MYVKRVEELNNADICLSQSFRHYMRAKATGSAIRIMDLYEKGVITKEDIKFLYFLYDVRMATKDQILRMFPAYTENFEDKTTFFIRLRLMNVFVISDDDYTFIQPDAFKIYTVDFSVTDFLCHFYNDEDLLNWSPMALIQPIARIQKILLATEFRVDIETRLAVKPSNYSSYRMFTEGRFRLIPEAQIIFSNEESITPAIVLETSAHDFLYGDSTKLNEMLGRYETWFTKNKWKKNFDCEPIVYILTDTEETMESTKGILTDMALGEEETLQSGSEESFVPLIDKVRITYYARMDEDLQTCFCKYDREKQQWKRVSSKMLKEIDRNDE